ncbi:hypothetical protein IJ182_05155 [bacterium]|nr:hypothetical protein [bacterium]
MQIKSSQSPLYINKFSNMEHKNPYKSAAIHRNFEANYKENPSTISFNGLFSSLANKIGQIFIPKEDEFPAIYNSDKPSSPLATEIAESIKQNKGIKIPPANFECIMTPSEIRKILPKLKEQNFECSEENVEKGIYCADLDYQSNFTLNSKETITEILDRAVKYADKYHEKTGEKFVFAFTDHDTVEGVQRVLYEVGKNPDKYKNLKIIPGLKLSYAHKAPNSKIGYENSDMLIYGINPFSKNITSFIDKTIFARKKMVEDFIAKVNELYPEYEYSVNEIVKQNGLKYKKSFAVSNLYWRIREYTETKGDIAIKSMSLDPDTIYNDFLRIMNTLDRNPRLGSQDITSEGLDTRIINQDDEVNKKIKAIFDMYSTHKDSKTQKVVSTAENVYDDMIECFSNETEKPVMALASPYYFSHYYEKSDSETFEQVVNFLKELKDNSNGMLIAFESLSPGYDLDMYLPKTTIDRFNNYIRENTKLYEVGGSFAKLKD